MAEKKTANSYELIKDEMKRGLEGVYFFYGEEDHMKQYYLHEAEKCIVGDRSSMNFVRLTADEFSPAALEEALGAAVICDMFSNSFEDAERVGEQRRLVELYEVDFKGLKPSELTATVKLLREKTDSDTVVIIYSTESELPSDSKTHQTIIRELSRVSKAICFSHESDAKLCSWLVRMSAKSHVELAPDTARLILERVGHSMLVLKNELEKLISYVLSNDRERITREDVAAIVVSNKEISPFDFANALMRRDARGALYVLEDMKERGEEPVVILSTVSRVIGDLIRVRGCIDAGMTRAETASKCAMHEYKVKLYSEQLKNVSIQSLFKIADSASRADVKLKSSPVDSYILLERLICELVSL